MGHEDYNISYSTSTFSEDGEHSWQNVHGLDECLASIETRVKDMAETITRLKEQNKALQEDKWVDERLAEMKKQYNEMYENYWRGFPITEEEKQAINKWLENHQHPGGAIGGIHTYEFVPTSIGVVGTIKCSCGESFTFCDL